MIDFLTLAQNNSGGAVAAGIFLLIWIVAVVFALALFVFWIWMLIHAIQNPRLDGTTKLIWVLVIIFLQALGAILYFLLGRGSK